MADSAAVREYDSRSDSTAEGTETVLQLAPDLAIVHDDETPIIERLGLSGPISIERRPADLVKRAFDIGVAGTALLVSLPLWVAVLAIVTVTQDGPVLFSQQRIGRSGRLFRCLKFRTMRVDADVVLRQVLDTDLELARQWQANQKLVEDPRVTRLGRFLRRFDLDEIPQFVNVLRGDMSIVGPRPVVLDEAPRFGTTLPTVLSVRPGLTGAWQVSGRNSVSYGERVQLEVRYVESRSLLGDLMICLRTPVALVRRNGGR